ncbi:MAG TPA: sulfite exporter TauE/SafE family protein [Usitatibacter sp.]|nr:sulfite exporter TauE/SafE family protein [Usitatibacter sp.]
MIDPGNLSPWLLLVAPLVIIVAYTVFGLSGFGSTVVSVPILAHFLPISYLVPLMALLDLASALIVGGRGREHLSREELKRLLPWMFVGFVVGGTVLIRVPDQYLRIALGLFAAAVGTYSIMNPVLSRTISTLWSIPAGIVGGAFATVFGAGGPVHATYLSGRLRDKNQIRATISTLISISALSRAVVYAISGLLVHMALFVGALVLSPFVWIGLQIGQRIHVGLSQEQMRRAVGGLLVATGLSLLVRALFQ